jgi:hypothetical protein
MAVPFIPATLKVEIKPAQAEVLKDPISTNKLDIVVLACHPNSGEGCRKEDPSPRLAPGKNTRSYLKK